MSDTKAGKQLLETFQAHANGYRVSRDYAAEQYARTNDPTFRDEFKHYDTLFDLSNANYTRVATALLAIERELRDGNK